MTSPTRTPDRDPFVAAALGRIDVPEPGTTFWADLDAALDVAVGAPERQAAPSGPTGPVHDLAPVVPLHERPTGARRRLAVLATAAAAALLVVALVVARNDSSTDVDLQPADSSIPATTEVSAPEPTTSTSVSGPATTAASPSTTARPASTSSKLGKATPDAAVIAWVEAIGGGRFDAAAALVGPRSEAYIRSLGGNVRGMMVESQEGYGAWADTPDRSTTEIELGTVDGTGSTVVVVSGTWRGEGEDGYRPEAIPSTRSGRDGTWLVEPMAFEPETGGRLEMIRPSSGESGLNGLAADATLEAAAPGSGTFWFSLDDSSPAKVPGTADRAGVRGTWDPPGRMASQSHLLVVAYTDGATFTAFAGIFAVEG